jgi:hypothetical protein
MFTEQDDKCTYNVAPAERSHVSHNEWNDNELAPIASTTVLLSMEWETGHSQRNAFWLSCKAFVIFDGFLPQISYVNFFT